MISKIERNKKGCGIKTVVRGLRAEKSFFDNCDKVAEAEKTTRNELILRVVGEYLSCKKV